MSEIVEVSISRARPFEQPCDALVVFLPEKEQTEVFRNLDRHMKEALSAVVREEQFRGKVGDTVLYHTSNTIGARRVILTGCGKKQECTEEILRRAAAVAATVARNAACARLAFTVPSISKLEPVRISQAILEGALLASYRFLKFKTKEEDIQPNRKFDEFILLAGDKGSGYQKAAERARFFAEATCFARDLVNEPANTLNPAVLSTLAAKISKEAGLGIRVLEKDELKKLGAGAILGVGAGSSTPPRLIELLYKSPKKTARKLALVGKGITFDSGGLSLKPSKNMESMKSDMAGAAAVLSAMRVISQIQPAFDVLGILCVAENMPSGSAIRPGDVLHAMNGKTIEIINTDAEGRLVLADGLSWAVRQGATEIVDLATLTGACVIGLGPYIAGVMGNDADLIQKIIEAGQAVGESFWELPVPKDYEFMIKSDIADIKNLSINSEAGAIQGALFLQEFIGNAKWAHLDIAGPSWYEKEFFHVSKNGTGFGVRTLLQFLSK
jgi:leucyl aminopeptidase